MVTDPDNWMEIKKCVYESDICPNKKLSLVETGCCMPPYSCEMKYVNATYWVMPRPDGSANVGLLNYLPFYGGDCNLCQEGYMGTIQHKWWQVGVFLLVITLLLSFFHFLPLSLTVSLLQYRENGR